MISDGSNDQLSVSRVLRDAKIERAHFDPTLKAHRESLQCYLDTGSWGAVQFYPEQPYVTVPETVLRKMCQHALKRLSK